MRGDVIIVEKHHHRAAGRVIESLLPKIIEKHQPHVISVGGESGSGKSETAVAMARALEQHQLRSAILQQDDYYVLPPKTNDAKRREDIGWVGPQEVKLDLIDQHLRSILDGAQRVVKPLMIYQEDRYTEETLELDGVKVVLVEGTYTSLLHNVDTRVFIARTREETMAARQKRGREPMDPFIEEVLKIEHGIIAKHRALADVVITRDYDVEL